MKTERIYYNILINFKINISTNLWHIIISIYILKYNDIILFINNNYNNYNKLYINIRMLKKHL